MAKFNEVQKRHRSAVALWKRKVQSVVECCFSPSLLVVYALGFPLQRLKSLEIIREIDIKGPYLGLITFYSLEEDAFFSTGFLEPDSQHPFLICLVNAAASTQKMLDLFNIEGLIHFWISGNLSSSLNIGDVVIPNRFVKASLWNWLDAEVPKNDFAKLEDKGILEDWSLQMIKLFFLTQGKGINSDCSR
ncbi:uncharacterized protein [Henckelia pumila]|uniref:uncharacterized protein isoform X2 n=1 Tax=Henckelia pumila TaxID=405737 RepID=UPI003C6E8C48